MSADSPSTTAEKGLPPAGVTAESAVAAFLATRESVQTRRVYGTAVREFLRQAGITMLAELWPEKRSPAEVAGLVRQYLDAVTKRAEAEPWRVLNPATVNARAAALRRFFSWLGEAYGYPAEPVDIAHTPLKTSRISGSASLTRREVTTLLGALERAAGRRGGEETKGNGTGQGVRELRDYLIVALLFGLALLRSEAAGLRFSVPGEWPRVPAPSDMRAAQFRVPCAAGHQGGDGELVLFFFGKGQGGSAEQNLDRWRSQFSQPGGTPSKDAGVVTIRTVNGLKQTALDVSGTYKPAPMGGAGGAVKSEWRLLGAVIEGSSGPWFWRLTGPEETVGAAKRQFEALLASLEEHQ